MPKSEKSSPRVASKAGKTLATAGAPARVKSLAGSALSQASSKKVSSARVAKTAAAVLAGNRSSKNAKSLAASVLTQRPSGTKKAASSGSAKGSVRTVTKSLAGSALAQHVSTRRTADGRSVRVVLTPISSGSLTRERVSKAVARVLTNPKKR